MEEKDPKQIDQFIDCDFFSNILGHLLYHILTAHSPFRSVNGLKTKIAKVNFDLYTKQLQFLEMATLLLP